MVFQGADLYCGLISGGDLDSPHPSPRRGIFPPGVAVGSLHSSPESPA